MLADRLPKPATSFIGRNRELAEIGALLADPACRLLTLLGPGGIGKTRLALQAAADQSTHFAHGVSFVPLAPVSSPDLIPSAIASSLQISFYDSTDPRLQLASYLREKHLLLILDNFEHLLDGVDLLTDILQAAPDVKLLVTSRERLNLLEEWVLGLDGLTVPKNSSAELDSYSAVQLFVQRARQVQTSFSLNANADAVRRICQRTEGMPLALELAATWLRVMSCAQIAQQIEANLNILTSTLRNMDERHRSLQAVFEQSWHLLSTAERDVLMRLSVFRGGFDLEAAERVAGASLSILASLADKSLIRVNADGRYDLHELLRQYAEERLKASGDSAAGFEAHSAYYLDFLARRDADVKGRRQQAALREIAVNFENILAGLNWAGKQQRPDLIQPAVLNCLINVGEMNNRLVDVRTMMEQMIAAFSPRAGEPPHLVWEQVVVRREWLNFHLNQPVDHGLVEAILGRARERDDEEEIAWCLWVLTDYAQLGNDPVRACAIAEETLARRQALGDEFYVAHALIGLHGAYLQAGQIDRHGEIIRESAAIRRKLGDKQGLCISLGWLGIRAVFEGNLGEAAAYLNQIIALTEDSGKNVAFLPAMAYKSALAFWRGDFEQADQFIQAGRDFAQDQEYLTGQSISLAVLGFGVNLRGDYVRGRDLCLRAAKYNLYDDSAWIGWGLALAYCGLGENSAAHQTLLSVLGKAIDSLKSPTVQRLCLPIAAILSARADQPERAAELLGLAYAAPGEMTGWMGKWPLLNEVQHQLEAQLGAEAFRAAWERGQTLDLKAVARALLEQGQPDEEQPRREPTQIANHSLGDPLSERELEILRLIADGASNSEIEQQLVIGMSTVKKHINHIFGKLGVESRTQAIVRAHALNLL